jgi:hypothetical protein
MYSEGFPGEDIPTHDELVDLAETADTLELLFQYMYRQRQPSLRGIPFQTLASLAEAVEKYRVFPAMEICKVHMGCVLFDEISYILLTFTCRVAVSEHAIQVLAYGSRHGYADLCDEAAPKTVGTSARDALTTLSLTTFAFWVILSCIRYRAAHLIVSKGAVS